MAEQEKSHKDKSDKRVGRIPGLIPHSPKASANWFRELLSVGAIAFPCMNAHIFFYLKSFDQKGQNLLFCQKEKLVLLLSEH
jgi:hypothetical protein